MSFLSLAVSQEIVLPVQLASLSKTVVVLPVLLGTIVIITSGIRYQVVTIRRRIKLDRDRVNLDFIAPVASEILVLLELITPIQVQKKL